MTIELSLDGDIATIAMDDGRANALNPPRIADFLDAFDEAESKAKAIIITGREGVFSGGFDLKWMPTATAEEIGILLDGGRDIVARVYGSPRPVIGACNGHAIAMGMFLLLSCDTRIGASGEFKFGANETLNGMNLPVFASEILKALIDPRKITEVAVQSRMFGPDEAFELGCLDRVVAPEEVLPTAQKAAQLLAQLPGGAYQFNKLAIRQPLIDRINRTSGGW